MNRNVNRTLCLVVVCVSMQIACRGFAAEPEISLIPGVPMLFVDDALLKECVGLRRIVHQGKHDEKPVITDTEPWELGTKGYGLLNLYGSVYPKEDGSGYRMWYGSYSRALVADSVDGVNWTKPILNVCSIGGSTSNNAVIASLGSRSILRDPFEKDPARRYKVVGCHYHKPGNPKTGYYTMTSPDGIHWSDERQIVQGWWDTCTMSQNPFTGEYLVYHKHEVMDNGCKRRTVFLTKSRDFIRWSEPVRAFGADEADDGAWIDNPTQFTDIYSMSVIGYAGGFIAFPSFFRMDRYIKNADKSRYMSAHDGPLYLGFAVSPDGEHWRQLPGRRPILPNNPYGVFNACYPGCASGGPGALLHVGDETWLYTYCVAHGHGTGYAKDWSRETCRVPQWSIGRAVWRRWGFVSIEAKSGHCRTRPLRLASGKMTVNFKRLEDGGRLKVAAFASDGQVLATAAVSGDGTRQSLNWNRPLPIGAPVELQFEVFNGALYSVEVE